MLPEISEQRRTTALNLWLKVAALRAAARGWQSGVLLFVLSCVYVGVSMERNIDSYDEGITLVGADRVGEGYVPHRDFYTQYGPAQFYLVAALFRLFGHLVLVERAWDVVARALLVVAVFVLTERIASRRLAFCAAAVSLAWQGAFWINGSAVFPALAAVVASLLFFLPTQQQAASKYAVFIAGVYMGVAALFRYDVGLSGCALGCASIAAARWVASAGPRRIFEAGMAPLPFLAGFVTVTLPVALWLAWAGALPDLMFDVFTVSKTYVEMRSLPLPGLEALRTDPASFGVYLPPVICVASLVSVTALLRRRAGAAAGALLRSEVVLRATIVLILTAFTVVFCAKGFVRTSNIHMSMALIVSTILLAQLVAGWRAQGAGPRAITGLSLGLALLFAGLAADTGGQRAASNWQWATSGTVWHMPQSWPALEAGPCRMPAELKRMACFPLGRATAETIRYISQHTEPSDRIFVGLPRHDRIVANDVALYFEVGRQPATKWYHFDPGLQTSAPIQREMVEELVHRKPKLIVIEDIFQHASEPNGSAKSSFVTLLDDYIHGAFKPVAQFGTYVVMAPTGG